MIRRFCMFIKFVLFLLFVCSPFTNYTMMSRAISTLSQVRFANHFNAATNFRQYSSKNIERQLLLLKQLFANEHEDILKRKIELLNERKKLKVLRDSPDIFFAPWRTKYSKKGLATSVDKNVKIYKQCPFCTQFSENKDRENFILKRLKYCVVMLNLYPYCIGHMLVLPYQHSSSLEQLSYEAKLELIETVALCTSIAKKALNNDACNVGINLEGRAAGGSLPDHLHVHIVPRWNGDTSFFTILANTQTIAADPLAIYDHLKNYFDNNDQ